MLYYLINRELNETSAVFCLGGPDANTYLQGQFTQELNRPVGTVAYGLFLNQKGKVIADGHILRLASDKFWLVSFSAAAPKLLERLEAYLIADDVTIDEVTGDWSRISLWGDEAALAVKQVVGCVPGPDTWCEGGRFRVFRGRRAAADNFEMLVPREALPEVVAKLIALAAHETDAVTAERTRILSGIPAVPADIGINDLPNEGGLEDAAISYTKGCYLGQEVMARLKNLGQVRRRLHLVRGEGEPPAAGAPLFQNDRKVGELRSVARDGGGFVAMAMLSLVNLNEAGGLGLMPNAPAVVFVTRRV